MTDLKAPEPRRVGPDLHKPELPSPETPTPDGLNLGGLNLDWAGYLAAGEYRRALAAVRLSPTPLPPALAGSLDALNDLREDIRAHRYPQARQALERLEAELSAPDTDPDVLRALCRHIDVQQLGVGLSSLEAADTARHVEPAELSAALAPALNTPLTRAEALNAVGVLHAVHEEASQARAAFEAALEADAGHYRAVSNIGNLELQAGNFKEAEAAQRRAIALNADFAGAQHNLGVALRKQGKVGESVRAIRRGQRLGLRQIRETESARLGRSGLGKSGPRKLNPTVLRVAGLLLAVLVFYLFLRP